MLRVPFLIVALLSVSLLACGDDDGTRPGTLRFGQVGEMRVTLVSPRRHNNQAGELQQILTWSSTGAWQIREAIYYRAEPGDENLLVSERDPAEYASYYATRITQFNDDPVLKLFGAELDTGLTPECGPGATRVTLRIRDQVKEETATWTRCTEGSLSTLTTSSAGPDEEAVRLIQAVILIRDSTVGSDFRSAYLGTVPFGTLDRGEDSGAKPLGPLRFLSPEPEALVTPEGWVEFWRAHKEDPQAQPPVVDWANEMVLVAANGKRTEAGDSIEIRRVLQIGDSTVVELFQRVPGDFCSPAAREHYPVHIIVAPRTFLPVTFSRVVEERVSCGF